VNKRHELIKLKLDFIGGMTFNWKTTEGVGFEPTERFHVHTLSKRAPSATQTPFRKRSGV